MALGQMTTVSVASELGSNENTMLLGTNDDPVPASSSSSTLQSIHCDLSPTSDANFGSLSAVVVAAGTPPMSSDKKDSDALLIRVEDPSYPFFFSRINDADICFKIVTSTQADGHHSKKATPPSSVNDPDIQDRLPDITNTIDQRSYESNSVLKAVETHSGNKKPSWCPASNKSGW